MCPLTPHATHHADEETRLLRGAAHTCVTDDADGEASGETGQADGETGAELDEAGVQAHRRLDWRARAMLHQHDL